MNLRPLPLIVAAVFLVTIGVVHGLRTDRWGMDKSVEEAVGRLDQVPAEAEGWTSTTEELGENEKRIGQIAGGLIRNYRDTSLGRQVSMLLVCGRPGPIAVHTPDICFRGMGYHIQTQPEKVDGPEGAGGGEAKSTFWMATFAKPDQVPQRVFWAWSPDGKDWQASDLPRIDYAHQSVLYKVYVVSPLVDPKLPVTDDPGYHLLVELLPQLKQALAP